MFRIDFKISIITICYNNEDDIRATIESVIEQTYDNIEYLVIDGKSSDNTIEIVNEYSQCIDHIITEPDEGRYDAINKGFELAYGDVCGLIHAGDRLFYSLVIVNIFKNFIIYIIYV